jgi:hypothetical protein
VKAILHGTPTEEGKAIMTTTTSDDHRTAGALMRTVAERLRRNGLKVTFPHRAEGRTLNVTGTRRVNCHVIVEDDSTACECSIRPASSITPTQISPIVAGMLGIEYTHEDRYTALHRGVPLAGAVAREMTARGLHVTMDVIEDHESYQAFADVIITSPAEPERGTVHLGDDGWVCWECHRDEIPGGTDGFADTIARFLTSTPPATVSDCLRDRLRRLSIRGYAQARRRPRT